jgi:hypothetical protein
MCFVLAKILCLQIANPQITNPQSATFTECMQTNKLFKSANLRICDFRYIFADRPPLRNTGRVRRESCVIFLLLYSFWAKIYIVNIPSQLVQPLEPSATLQGFLALSPYALNATNVQPK